MKTKIILAVIIAIMFWLVETTNWYNYKWKEYNISVPANIIYLDNCYFSGRCEVPKYEAKLIYLNYLLINRWYNPIY